MTGDKKTVCLSVAEAEYISNLRSEDDSFAMTLRDHPGVRMSGRTITLSRANAEVLREHFTQRLAKVGFDAEYKPNREGQILEQLIDKFFLRERP